MLFETLMTTQDFYRSRLPHIQPLGGTFFVTTRLAGSVPQVEKQRMAEEFLLRQRQILTKPEHTSDELERLSKHFFVAYESILEKADFGPKWLSVNTVAELVINALHFFDAKRYELIAYCLMSNHIHIVFTLNMSADSKYGEVLQQVMHSFLSYTAIKCNEMLDR